MLRNKKKNQKVHTDGVLRHRFQNCLAISEYKINFPNSSFIFHFTISVRPCGKEEKFVAFPVSSHHLITSSFNRGTRVSLKHHTESTHLDLIFYEFCLSA